MSLLPLFQWMEGTAVGDAIGSSNVLSAALQIVHLLGMALLVGAIMSIDLRLLSRDMRRQSLVRIAEQLAPLTWVGLAVMLLTGSLLLTAQALRFYHNRLFWLKLALLSLAVVFHFTIHVKVTSEFTSVTPTGAKLVAWLSLTLWIGTALAGKAMDFY